MRIFLAAILILTTISCGKQFRLFKRSSQEKQTLKIEGTLKVQVYYEPGAEPYTDVALTGLPILKVWNVLDKNLKAMFPTKNVIVPMDLIQMSPISAKNKSTWTNQEIYDLGSSVGSVSAGDTTVLNVFFLKGKADQGSNIIGLHISNTQTMAIFKEVIEGTSSGLPGDPVPKYVEQGTLVHEIGHAVGLVNNGISMVTSHEDTAHIRHCNNPKCVMYWQNEGNASALASFLQTRINNPDLVMLDEACLKDVTSHK